MTAKKSPAAAEALGEMTPFHFEGNDYFLKPAAEWSFDAMEAYEEGRIFFFLREILGEEGYATLKATKPNGKKLGEFVAGTQKALGIAGKLISLVRLLREDSDVVEADLQRFYGVDLADFWRGELSIRRLSVLISKLPADSATVAKASDLSPGWDVHAFLLADVYAALCGKEHPARPQPKKESRYAKLREALERQKARVNAQSPDNA
ncbi:tail assembly chaperone [Arthrobacter phage Tweety19]|uniref:Tail assembly chaperone n=1 Tax=Arthrobacter phage Tweety19 TaxID=2768133 RepID=A0A7G9W213_9CAUD|nr:tail assembly chaperone [Arthrobacter phage Tweety19]QNO12676.1 tail assembly chaperone [Arthrobacter phage Tweety19]